MSQINEHWYDDTITFIIEFCHAMSPLQKQQLAPLLCEDAKLKECLAAECSKEIEEAVEAVKSQQKAAFANLFKEKSDLIHEMNVEKAKVVEAVKSKQIAEKVESAMKQRLNYYENQIDKAIDEGVNAKVAQELEKIQSKEKADVESMRCLVEKEDEMRNNMEKELAAKYDDKLQKKAFDDDLAHVITITQLNAKHETEMAKQEAYVKEKDVEKALRAKEAEADKATVVEVLEVAHKKEISEIFAKHEESNEELIRKNRIMEERLSLNTDVKVVSTGRHVEDLCQTMMESVARMLMIVFPTLKILVKRTSRTKHAGDMELRILTQNDLTMMLFMVEVKDKKHVEKKDLHKAMDDLNRKDMIPQCFGVFISWVCGFSWQKENISESGNILYLPNVSERYDASQDVIYFYVKYQIDSFKNPEHNIISFCNSRYHDDLIRKKKLELQIDENQLELKKVIEYIKHHDLEIQPHLGRNVHGEIGVNLKTKRSMTTQP